MYLGLAGWIPSIFAVHNIGCTSPGSLVFPIMRDIEINVDNVEKPRDPMNECKRGVQIIIIRAIWKLRLEVEHLIDLR